MGGGSALGAPQIVEMYPDELKVLPVHPNAISDDCRSRLRQLICPVTDRARTFVVAKISTIVVAACCGPTAIGQTYRPQATYPSANPSQQVPGQAASFRMPAAASTGVNADPVSARVVSPQAQAALAGPNQAPQLRKLAVPAQHVESIATALNMRFQDLPGVTIAPDPKNSQLVVMAPPSTQATIAGQVQTMVAGAIRQTSSSVAAPLSMRLENISWREFERDLKQAAGSDIPMTTRNNGNEVTFQMNVSPMRGTMVQVDRRQNFITVHAPDPVIPGWEKMIRALDRVPNRYDDVTKVHRLENAEMAPVQRTMRLLKALRNDPLPAAPQSIFQNAVLQADQSADTTPPAGEVMGEAGDEPAGPLGDVQIEYVPELGQIIVKGTTRDVQRVMDLIKEIESKAELTQPDSKIVTLEHADANAVSELLSQLYDDVLSSRQGDVSITSLDSPNALLLIGRTEAIASLEELIAKIDLPVDPRSRLRVFRLQNASAVDAEETIRGFFVERPGSEEDQRPGLGTRVRVSADYRTNSLIVSASPRDMTEVTRLINELDVEKTSAKMELRVFQLQNAIAEDLATTLQDAFSGGDLTASEDATAPSASLTIVSVDSEEKRIVESGILSGATISAESTGNSIVVRAPSTSMPLIAELIRQLDRAPGIDSLVKVFTVENGDATQLTAALEQLFGSEAATGGTGVGGANLAGLPSSTAATESSLVPLRFSTDIRTNSIVASGSASDLEVVESILIRLDSEGFAERITEVIWLKNNNAADVANAITSYVSSRLQSQTQIQQFQQGLSAYDLLDRDIIAVAEEYSNSILLSVSPRLYEEVRALIDRLDRRRPMVLIKVVLAEVSLNDQFEIGTELGLQDSLAFSRDQAVADTFGTRATGASGFNFNNAGVANVNDLNREDVVGGAVSTFGLGQTNPSIGYGGFVLNAASESVSLLFRTLQDAGRAQIISTPKLMTADNTNARIEVGREIARFRGNTVSGNGVISPQIQDIQVGLIMDILPRIGRDGTIALNLDITRSDRDQGTGTLVPTGVEGETVLIEDIINTTAQVTLSVYSGQTVIVGGLIQKSRANQSRRMPYLSNIPILGNLFKYDYESEARNELLIVMTPMLITGDQDLEYVKQTESSRMSWCLADVVEAHGDVGLSGGYGLWGPAIGPTIYPDVQPTVDGEMVIGNVPDGLAPDRSRDLEAEFSTSGNGASIYRDQSSGPVITPAPGIAPEIAPPGLILEEDDIASPTDQSVLPTPVINQSSFQRPAGTMNREQTLPASWMAPGK
ncbi:secretin N-terminal domain-containing protein [Rhodopirellula sp. MGV]|uniref:secretin N-terminal domain-containing protein n=1 Tax=Rhodopirellula sp. MGV TaxID=2023130 RepID=UPI001E4094E5|nr:secretin N-terminal domain-containing protein [Rhodopirellula sp. MGV]